MITTGLYAALYLLQLAVIVRALLRPNREPASRIAWVVVIAILPGIGIVAYLLLGETNIGRKRVARAREVLESLRETSLARTAASEVSEGSLPHNVGLLFRLGESVNGFKPVAGNAAMLTADSNAAIDNMVADMDAAREHIHLAFYIWLGDNNGLKVVEALKRPAARGETVQVLVR